jgi:DNA-directed RNA polymerase subunit RPC12/RpoP
LQFSKLNDVGMPTYQCPNCNRSVQVRQEQFGKALRCSKCGGKFTVDPSLPQDAEIEPHDAITEPRQDTPPDDLAPASDSMPDVPTPPALVITPPTKSQSHESVLFWKGTVPDTLWGLFWILFAIEILLGALYGMMFLEARRSFFGTVSEAGVCSCLLLCAVHTVIWMYCLYSVAKESRRFAESIAPWLILMVLLQAFGLALFLVSRSDDHNPPVT